MAVHAPADGCAPVAGAITPGAEAPKAPVQPILTTHRIFEACDTGKKSLALLHGDLFDSRPEVALSALEALGSLGDAKSFPHVARLLAGAPEDLRCACVRALGGIPHPDVPRFLKDLAGSAGTEKLRREILGALAAAAPEDEEVLAMIRLAARTPLGSAGGRAHAAGLLLKIDGETALEELLVDAREEVLEQVIAAASKDPSLRARTVARCAPLYTRLAARNRALLVTVSSAQLLPESAALLRSGLGDANAEVRRAAYAALGTEPHQTTWFPDTVSRMATTVETNPVLEEEAQAAIARMARLPGARAAIPSSVRVAIMSCIAELYRQLGERGRTLFSDTHELGWLITRSRDYLEYYGDEDLKAALLRWLKGTSSDTADGLLRMLKATAVRVEVRHFDGYSALTDLIKNPRRNGIALVARELALVRTGKARVLWQLARAIRLSAIFLAPGGPPADGQVLREIYAWSRHEKLYRLAEAALSALARVDPPAAEAACSECLTLPLASKILAIASLHLLREINPGLLEPAVARLLAAQDDPYVTLNALEAISAALPSADGELTRALLARFSMDVPREVRDALTGILGRRIPVDITESLKEHILSGDETRRSSALAVLDLRVDAGLVASRDATVELLYRVLRGEHQPSRRSAALLLWKMHDEYAAEVLKDFLGSGSEEVVGAILRRVAADLREPLLSGLAPLFHRDSTVVQEALREALVHSAEPAVKRRALEMALEARTDAAADDDEPEGMPSGESVGVPSERSTFQFERENMQELVVFFSDIQGFSKKAEALSPLELATLLNDYEKHLHSCMEAHRGELIKRMGDGHMFVFREPLHAVLAAIRIQKSLRRFNRYRDAIHRVIIRIGIHRGRVVRGGSGDVLGNAVNIASRLERAATPGSILVSDEVEARVREYVHVREIGRITVKNISEPLRVFEPYEIVLDLPSELDPLRTPPAAGADPSAAARITLDRDVYAQIVHCFSSLSAACRQAQSGQVPVSTLNELVLARWNLLLPRLPAPPASRTSD